MIKPVAYIKDTRTNNTISVLCKYFNNFNILQCIVAGKGMYKVVPPIAFNDMIFSQLPPIMFNDIENKTYNSNPQCCLTITKNKL